MFNRSGFLSAIIKFQLCFLLIDNAQFWPLMTNQWSAIRAVGCSLIAVPVRDFWSSDDDIHETTSAGKSSRIWPVSSTTQSASDEHADCCRPSSLWRPRAGNFDRRSAELLSSVKAPRFESGAINAAIESLRAYSDKSAKKNKSATLPITIVNFEAAATRSIGGEVWREIRISVLEQTFVIL